MQEQFSKMPKTLEDIGTDNFLKIPFYKRNNNLEVVYINPIIYEKVFSKKYNYEQAKKDIIERFSVTLEEKGEIIGYGYVDKQADPTDIALNGNKGSGRAFYLYENCNIKGEKTPFATSPRDDYNNGKYSLDCAIQECLISNVLNRQSTFCNFETLAIIDTKEEYLFPHTSEKLPCGLIIRYYEDKELYRFSHRFVNNIPFNKSELINLSNKIGELEGNKFIKRFLHGAWSIGNLSIDSNMIDLDTSFFVIGRHPQWSFTDRYITNYFGFEEKGQVKVLETIVNSNLNIETVSLDELSKIIEDQKLKTIRKNLLILMGYNEFEYAKYSQYFDKLADEFIYLSQLIFDNYDNLNCLDENCQNTNLFNFSNFFRYYELLKQKGIWNKQQGLNLLLNKNARLFEYNYHDDNYHEKILSFFRNIIIDSDDKYLDALNRALLFIDEYDRLNELIDTNERINKNQKLIKSYLENEDKIYLTARKWMRAELIDMYQEKGTKYVNDIINTIINFYSDKDYSKDDFLCDLYIFDKGILFREISVNGYNRICLKLSNSINEDSISIYLNGKEIILYSEDKINYYSDKFDNTNIFPFNNVVLKIGITKINCIDCGRENGNYKTYIETIHNNSQNITEEDIKKYLQEHYNIEVLDIKRMVGSSARCYCIVSTNKKYFLKVFEQDKSIESIILESEILNILDNNKILVPKIIKTNNGKISLLVNNHFFILENFIEGKTFHKDSLSKELLLESSDILGKIHQILSTKFSWDYNVSYLSLINVKNEYREIDYLIDLIEKNKDNENYGLLKDSLNYKKSMLMKVQKYREMFQDLTMSMTHGDYSKRQIISEDNKIKGIVDFSSCDFLPVALEVIRSYFLSTLSCEKVEEFDYELFSDYIEIYLKQFCLKENDLIAMPYLLLTHFVLSKYGYIECVYNNRDKEDIIKYILWKDKICKFLEENAVKMTEKLKKISRRL